MTELKKKAQSNQIKDNVLYMQILIDNIKDSLSIIDEVSFSKLNSEIKETRKFSQAFWIINCIKTYLDLNKQFNGLGIPNQSNYFLNEFNMIKIKESRHFLNHPTTRSIEFIAKMLSDFSKEGNIIQISNKLLTYHQNFIKGLGDSGLYQLGDFKQRSDSYNRTF